VWNRPAAIGVTVSANGVTPTGTVELRNGSTVLGRTQLTNGVGVIHLPAKLLKRGTYILTLVYSGDNAVKGSSATVTFHVTNPGGE
jgi:5'-nucleotidase